MAATVYRRDFPRAAVQLLPALLLTVVLSSSQTHARGARAAQTPPETTKSKTSFDGQRAFEHVRKLVEFGPRPSGSEALAQSRRYIESQLRSLALKVKTDEWKAETPKGKVRMANVIAELPGETDDAIIIASHYDTKHFKDFGFVGANDGGSSTGALLELARALSNSEVKRRFTYRFAFFDGEESTCPEWDECSRPDKPDNTYGSRRYVARLREQDKLRQVRALVLLDLVGYEKLELGRESISTPWLLDIIWQTARELGYAEQFVEREEGVGDDDHAPFLRAGVPAVDLIQLETYPHWHTREDTLDKISPRSLQTVGEVVLASLPRIEEKLKESRQ